MKGGDEIVAALTGPLPHLMEMEWKCLQVFDKRTAGEEVQEGDCLTWYLIELKRAIFFHLSDPIHALAFSILQQNEQGLN